MHVSVMKYEHQVRGRKARDASGAITSGATEDHTEFDVQMESIRSAHANGDGQIKLSRNSFGIGGTRAEGIAKMNEVLAGSVRSRAAVAVKSVWQQIKHRDMDEHGIVTPVTMPDDKTPAKRKSRGKGRTASMHQPASIFSQRRRNA